MVPSKPLWQVIPGHTTQTASAITNCCVNCLWGVLVEYLTRLGMEEWRVTSLKPGEDFLLTTVSADINVSNLIYQEARQRDGQSCCGWHQGGLWSLHALSPKIWASHYTMDLHHSQQLGLTCSTNSNKNATYIFVISLLWVHWVWIPTFETSSIMQRIIWVPTKWIPIMLHDIMCAPLCWLTCWYRPQSYWMLMIWMTFWAWLRRKLGFETSWIWIWLHQWVVANSRWRLKSF